MSTRITSTFRRLDKAGESALVVALPVGCTSLDLTRRLLPVVGRQGADLVQLDYEPGVAPDVTLDDCLRVASEGRRTNEVPLILRLSWLSMLDYGAGEFVAHCAVAGIDALLLPDLPEIEAEGLGRTAEGQGLSLVRVITREDDISPQNEGLLYWVGDIAAVRTDRMGASPLVVLALESTPHAVGTAAGVADAVLVTGLRDLIAVVADEVEVLIEVSEWVRALKEATVRRA